MTFTDDDLKRLKEVNWSEHEKHQPRDCGELASLISMELPALLARLEAAEKVLESHDTYHIDKALWDVWRKAAGR